MTIIVKNKHTLLFKDFKFRCCIGKNNFSKKNKFTRFVKGKLTFSKKGNAEFKILRGQESYKIKPFTQSNSWGVFKNGKSKFKKNKEQGIKKEIIFNRMGLKRSFSKVLSTIFHSI